MSILWIIVILLTATCAGALEIKHLELDQAHLVEVSESNYGLTHSGLNQLGWKTISANNGQVYIWTNTCKSIVKSLKNLSTSDRHTIYNAIVELEDSATSTSQSSDSYKHSSSSFTSERGSTATFSESGNIQTSNFNSHGLSVTKQENNNFSVAKANLPNNLARIFVHDDVVTFVYLSGLVSMKPYKCLRKFEKVLIEDLKRSMLQVDRNLGKELSKLEEQFSGDFMGGDFSFFGELF